MDCPTGVCGGDNACDTYGYPCGTDDSVCTELPGEECCTDSHCQGSCFRPCTSNSDCPESYLGCEHNYCLIRCTGNASACNPYPGFTCQHGGDFCENN
jgi:hypothetical protein